MCGRALYTEQTVFTAHKNTNKQASNIMCSIVYVGEKNGLIISVYIFEKLKILESIRWRTVFKWKTYNENAINCEVLKMSANELILKQ